MKNCLSRLKCSLIIILLLPLVGCVHSRERATLTAEQAKTLAMRLANDKVFTLYHCQPFWNELPAHFEAGHWIWVDKQGFGHGDFNVRVELSADGSTNNVGLEFFSNENPVPTPIHR
jgi:hypothetical protein